jgi:hypothetical protein
MTRSSRPAATAARSRFAPQLMPPLTRMAWPLIQCPEGLARNATTAAMSAGVPSRSSGTALANRLSALRQELDSRLDLLLDGLAAGGGRC